MQPESRSQTPAMLETIRRALGRLATQARVQRIDLGALVPRASIRPLSVHGGERPRTGAREQEANSREVIVQFVAPPSDTVVAGGALSDQDPDSLFYCRISANSAAFRLAQSARLGSGLVQNPIVRRPSSAVPAPDIKTVRAAGLTPGTALEVFARPMLPGSAPIHTLPIGPVAAPAPTPRRHGFQKNGLPGALSARVLRVPPALVERIPLDRARLPMPSRDSLEWQAAYLQERQLLAHSAGPGISFTEIDLVGIYRAVPITAARRLEVEKGTNSLLLYLRPQVATGSDITPKTVVTIAIGRVKSDGRLVRSVIKH